MTNKEKYEQIFIDRFLVTKDQLNETLVYNSIPAWDSVGHMAMIASLEESFDLMMETDDIIDFSSFTKGMQILSKYNITF
jgi:acyl carrier protein